MKTSKTQGKHPSLIKVSFLVKEVQIKTDTYDKVRTFERINLLLLWKPFDQLLDKIRA